MNRLVYSHSDADMYYATRFRTGDPFLYFEKGKQTHIILSPLEFDRGQREAQVDEVINLSELTDRIWGRGKSIVAVQNWIAEVLKKYRVGPVHVSPSFPIRLWNDLRSLGVRLRIANDGIFPERAIKKKDEIVALRQSLKVTAGLLEHAIGMIRASRPNKKKFLMLGGSALTSERMQSAILMEAARVGFDGTDPIVAGGIQACDPHERGHGILRANELIILDIFPKNRKSGYWGDMTRTVIKGRATEAQRHQFEAVHHAQKLAIRKLRAGINGKSVHEAIHGYFKHEGYLTGNSSGRYEGFFHGTGHGLGLDIHEAPRVSGVSQILQAGNVVTVEPGLYYPAVGGVRIEDVVLLERGGCRLLSHFPVELEV